MVVELTSGGTGLSLKYTAYSVLPLEAGSGAAMVGTAQGLQVGRTEENAASTLPHDRL